MRAQVFGKIDIARLVERAGQLAGFEHRTQDSGRIARIDAYIAVAQIGSREQGRAAGKIKNDIATRYRTIARYSEFKRATR